MHAHKPIWGGDQVAIVKGRYRSRFGEVVSENGGVIIVALYGVGRHVYVNRDDVVVIHWD